MNIYITSHPVCKKKTWDFINNLAGNASSDIDGLQCPGGTGPVDF